MIEQEDIATSPPAIIHWDRWPVLAARYKGRIGDDAVACAVHEAGHAVAAVALGWRVDTAWVQRSLFLGDGWHGLCVQQTKTGGAQRDREFGIICAAGRLAETLFWTLATESDGDRQELIRCAERLHGSAASTDRILQEMDEARRQAAEIVGIRINGIERLADHILSLPLLLDSIAERGET